MLEYDNEESITVPGSNNDEISVSSIPSQSDSKICESDSTNSKETNCLRDNLVNIEEFAKEHKEHLKYMFSVSPTISSEHEVGSSEILDDLNDKTVRSNSKEDSVLSTNDSKKHRLTYSRDQLLKLMDVPASRLWPVYFDVTFQKPQGKIDLDRWTRAKQDSQRGCGATVSNPTNIPVPQSNGGVPVMQNLPNTVLEIELKRSRDPRDRVKQEEQDGIVLSPQRRSFGTGCHAFTQGAHIQPTSNVPEAPIERSSRESHREIPVRRIGSGRILRREEPDQIVVNERKRDTDKEIESRRDHKDWRNKNESRYEREERQDKRRRFFEEEEKRTNDRKDTRDRRFPEHRRPMHFEDEAPEWFTGGPSSQNEYIELVGFDETEENNEKRKAKKEKRRLRREKEGSRKGSRSNTPTIQQDVQTEISDQNVGNNYEEREKRPENPIVIEPHMDDQDAMQFDIEDYLGPLLIASDETVQDTGASSRLRQFFKDTDSPVICMQGSRQNSGDFKFSDSTIRIPSPNIGVDSTCFFSPISPADNSGRDALAGLLQQATAQTIQHPMIPGSGRLQPPSVKDLMMGGKSQSLEEIEACLRKGQKQSCNTSISTTSPSMTLGSQQTNTTTSMKQGNGVYQKNPFNDFLSQVSQPQRKILAEQSSDCDNVLTKLLKDSNVMKAYNGKNPALPNNATTETELITNFMKGKNVNLVNGITPSQLNNNIHQQLFAQQHSVNNLSVPSQTLSHNMSSHSPSHSHMMPPQTLGHPNQEFILKLMQNQQHLQNQKKQIIHHNYQQQHNQHQHMDPIKQLIGGLNNLGLNQTHSHEPTFRESHLRPDIQNLLQCVLNGQIKESLLIAQLNSGNVSHQQREAITAVLKMLNNSQSGLLMPPRSTLTPSPTAQNIVSGALSLGTPASLSPRVASPIPDSNNLLAPHVMQQTRVSPLMFTGGNIPGSAPRRTPSHQELVVHAQSILQKALLKQELEKAKEKHRKREAERTRSPNPAVSIHNGSNLPIIASIQRTCQDGSPSNGTKCQSPLAFTPTSVMRKMTAERERIDKGDKHESVNYPVADKSKDNVSPMSHNVPPPPAILQNQQGPFLKIDGNMRRVSSPNQPAAMLSSSTQIPVSSQNSVLIGMGESHCPPILSSHRNVSMGRNSQHNIRVLQNMQPQGIINQQIMRNTSSNLHLPHSHLPLQPRYPNNNALQHNIFSNNNNYKEHNQHSSVNNGSSHRNSPVSLRNLFGRDVVSQVHAGIMPELPDGKVLSLEEVERLHQSQIVPK